MSVPVIVCVDDEKIVLDSLKDQIKHRFGESLYIETAESGEEALELITELLSFEAEIPLVICDYLMPHMKGDEVLSRIKTLSPETSGMLLTGHATLKVIKNAVNSGIVNRYLEKPWDKSILYMTIEDVLRKYSKKSELDNRRKSAKNLELQLEQKSKLLNDYVSETPQKSDLGYIKDYIKTTSHEINSTLMTVLYNIESIKQMSYKLPENDIDSSNAINNFYKQTSLVLENLIDAFSTSCAADSTVFMSDIPSSQTVVKPHKTELSGFNRIEDLVDRIDSIERQIKRQEERIVLWDDEEMLVFSLNDILCFTAENRATFALTKKGKYKAKETLDSLEERLSDFHFFRCHRGFLINLDHISKITPWLGNNSYVSKLAGIDIDIPISRTKVKSIKQVLGILNQH